MRYIAKILIPNPLSYIRNKYIASNLKNNAVYNFVLENTLMPIYY